MINIILPLVAIELVLIIIVLLILIKVYRNRNIQIKDELRPFQKKTKIKKKMPVIRDDEYGIIFEKGGIDDRKGNQS